MPYCITHNDLDGLGCAILLEKIFPNIQTFAIDYRELDEVLPKVLNKAIGDVVFITDISMNESQAELCNNHGKVQHIDHHSSSKHLMDKYPWSMTDVNHCATYHLFTMLSNYAVLNDYKDFVTLVDNYDTWGHGTQPTEEAKDLNRLKHMIGEEAFVIRFKGSASTKLSSSERALITTDKFHEEKYLREAVGKINKLQDKDGNTFLVIAAEQYTSPLGNYLLQKVPGAEYVIILDMLNDKASLRSRGNVDVGELARPCGGGGHKKAAGFPLSDMALKSFWRCNTCERWQSGNTTVD